MIDLDPHHPRRPWILCGCPHSGTKSCLFYDKCDHQHDDNSHSNQNNLEPSYHNTAKGDLSKIENICKSLAFRGINNNNPIVNNGLHTDSAEKRSNRKRVALADLTQCKSIDRRAPQCAGRGGNHHTR